MSLYMIRDTLVLHLSPPFLTLAFKKAQKRKTCRKVGGTADHLRPDALIDRLNVTAPP